VWYNNKVEGNKTMTKQIAVRVEVCVEVRVEDLNQDLVMAGLELLILSSQDDDDRLSEEPIDEALLRFSQVSGGWVV
jgi:hypothetical protein